MDQIIKIASKNNVLTEVIESTRDELTITFKSQFTDTLYQVEAIVAIMGLLSKENVVPAEVIKTWSIKNSKKSVNKIINKIEMHEKSKIDHDSA